MATTFSGRLVTPGNFGVPSPLDLAVQRGRMPRFAGATDGWWSVLHHVRVLSSFAGELPRALALLHDGEEACTYDTMTTWKTPEQRALERRLERRIQAAYMGRLPTAGEAAAVKRLDMECLRAEMLVLGPPGVLAHSGLDRGDPPRPAVEATVRAVRWGGSTTPDSELVRWYVAELEHAVDRRRWEAYS